MKSNSWIIVEKSTGEAVLEVYDQSIADAINRDKFDVIPAYEYLTKLNNKFKVKQGCK